ncbi:hypothetical protein ACFY5F_36365 [Streptomyces sp. NPDC013161]|uniref:hypothetical protein n=1 Tax=Streptomyces sp. NPDC013161 TaxID=3364862 RepID=UPI0036BD8212
MPFSKLARVVMPGSARADGPGIAVLTLAPSSSGAAGAAAGEGAVPRFGAFRRTDQVRGSTGHLGG